MRIENAAKNNLQQAAGHLSCGAGRPWGLSAPGLYTILEGSMYPILYRLNDSGYISFFEKKVGRRQTRIYYHLEDNGLMYLDNLQTSFQQYVNLIQFLLTSKEGETYEEKTG